MDNATAVVLTISDSASQGRRNDLSGPAVAWALGTAGFQVIRTAILPDELDRIREQLIGASDMARLVVTVGGTGIATRDVTPEATLAVVERLIEGIPEKMRIAGSASTPLAALSRGVCGVRGRSLILNLPGSPKAAVESLQSILDILPHALDLLSGQTEHGIGSS